jgi:hypothetical protein
VVCLPLRSCLGLPASVEKLALLVDCGLVRPKLWHECSAIVFAHRVDTQLRIAHADHPAHSVYLEQSRSFLPRKCPRYRIPFAKAVKAVEAQLGVDHNAAEAASISSLRKLSLTRQIGQIQSPKGQRDPSHFASVYANQPKAASYVMLDSRSTAKLRARLRMNRHHLRSRQWLLLLSDSSLCPTCKALGTITEENPEHVLMQCPRFQTARMQLSEECKSHGVALTMCLATGDFSEVPNSGIAAIRTATAHFLHQVDDCLHI